MHEYGKSQGNLSGTLPTIVKKVVYLMMFRAMSISFDHMNDSDTFDLNFVPLKLVEYGVTNDHIHFAHY